MKKKIKGYTIRLFNKNNEEYDSITIQDVKDIMEMNKEIIYFDLEYYDEFYNEANKAEKIIIEKLYY